MTEFLRMHLPIPADLLYLWQVIHDAGHDVLFVGGCVRDMILGEPVHDYDLATSAQPEQIMALFPRCIPTGIRHGTVTVLHHGRSVEVTTFRTEDHYRDSRRPDSVVFVSRVDEDLQRRDFTCNSMAYRPDKGLLDLFDGLGDLNRHCLRTVGSAAARFSEDALRMLRAVRFSSQLNLDPEQSLLVAAQIQRDRIRMLSRERIASELSRLFGTRFPDRLHAFTGAGILEMATASLDLPIASESTLVLLLTQMIPGQDNRSGLPYSLHIPAGLSAILLCLSQGDSPTGILDLGRQPAFIRTIRSTLIHDARFASKIASEATAFLVAFSNLLNPYETGMAYRVRSAAARIHLTCLLDPDEARTMVVHACSLLSVMQDAPAPFRWPGLTDGQPSAREALAAARDMCACRDIVAVTELPVRGRDLIALGMSPGPALGYLLESLLEDVMQAREPISRETLLSTAADRIANKHVYPESL